MRHLLEETLLRLGQAPLQLGTITDDPALRRRPGTETATQRTDLVVGIRFLRRQLLHPSLDTHLALQGRPEEGHGSHRVGLQLPRLVAFVVAEKAETAIVQRLEQKHTAMRPSFGIDGGQRHGVRLHRQLLGLHGIVEPLPEQTQGIIGGIRLAEPVTGVIAAHISQSLGHHKLPETVELKA